MNKSYLLQGFKATRKTYKTKKSNMFTFIFYTLTSFFGKLLILPTQLFKMFDMNLAKNAALHNEVSMAEGFRGADSFTGNVKLHVIGLLRILLTFVVLLVCGGLFAILYLIGVGLFTLSDFNMITLALVIPVGILSIVLLVVLLSVFTPSTYVTLHLKEKTLSNILHCCKKSLKVSMIFKIVLYNLIYILALLVLPVAMIFLLSGFELNILIGVVIIMLLIAQVYVFGYFKLSRDIAIYLLFRNNVSLDPKTEKRDSLDLSEEEKLTDIFTQE